MLNNATAQIAIEIITENITDPPYESNGKGTPTTGMSPVTIAVLNITYKKRLVPMPKEINLPNFE